jgi:hypothetical protein
MIKMIKIIKIKKKTLSHAFSSFASVISQRSCILARRALSASCSSFRLLAPQTKEINK